MYGLLKLELEEASKRLGQKMALLLLAAFMAFFGYLLCMVPADHVMAYYWNIIAGLAVTAGSTFWLPAIALAMFSPHSRYSHRPRYGGRT